MEIIPIKTRLFILKENIADFIVNHIPKIEEGDVVFITSKIVALSEDRVVSLDDKEKTIIAEAKGIIKTPWALLTLTEQGWSINAGADESNANNKVILLPKNPQKKAQIIRKGLLKRYGIKKLGIVITDTRSSPLRVGTVGRAIGYAGFEPIKSYKNKKDLFGRKSRVTESNMADGLATAAVLVMGEGNEQIPLVVIKKAPIIFTSKNIKTLLSLSPETDIYKYVFRHKKRRGN